VDQLVGKIQEKTGAGREEIEGFLDHLSLSSTATASSAMDRATEAARQYAQQASSTVQRASRQAMEGMRESYSQAGRVVQQHPTESVAVALGTGLITGVILGLLLRSSR
jgi:ElaB/YqjD/DUF883 family membrane-anchored ribosome-binding protein